MRVKWFLLAGIWLAKHLIYAVDNSWHLAYRSGIWLADSGIWLAKPGIWLAKPGIWLAGLSMKNAGLDV